MLNPNEPGNVVTPMHWPVRDGFIADTAIKLDHLQATVGRLDREAQLVKNILSEMQGTLRQADRMKAFEESLRNSREYKIDELMRCIKDVKARLDDIEGNRSAFLNLAYRSFPAVDKRLAELGKLEASFNQSLRRQLAYFAGTLVGLAAILAVRFT